MFTPTLLRLMLVGALSGLHALSPSVSRAEDAGARAIEERLRQWTDDFNARRVDRVCDLFAPDLRSNYRGQPENTYETLCAHLHDVLSRESRSYSYALDLQEILVSGDMAAVRLIWRLTVTDAATGSTIHSSDRGLDVFRLEPDGKWRIARFLAYEMEEE